MLRPEALPSYYQWPPSLRHVRLLTALHVQLLTRRRSVCLCLGASPADASRLRARALRRRDCCQYQDTVRSVLVRPVLVLLIVSLGLLVTPLNVSAAAGAPGSASDRVLGGEVYAGAFPFKMTPTRKRSILAHR